MSKTKFFICLIGAGILIFGSSDASLVKNQATAKTNPATSQKEISLAQNPGFLKTLPDFGKIPLYFVHNRGQTDEEAVFYAKASRYTLWLTQEGLVFDSARATEKAKGQEGLRGRFQKKSPVNREHERDVSRLLFLNANQNAEITALNPTEHYVNYFLGDDPSEWRTDVPTSQAVLYREVYPKIDLKIYGVENQIEYDWVVRPGGDPGIIKYEYRDVIGTRLDEEGNLVVKTRFGEMMHKRPVSYQKAANSLQGVKVTYKEFSQNTWGFKVEDYDKTQELVIDPLMVAFSSYLGGSDFEASSAIAVDNTGAVFVGSQTYSADFPLKNPFRSVNKGGECCITKIDPAGNSLVWSTFLGGSFDEGVNDFVLDAAGNVYIAGVQ